MGKALAAIGLGGLLLTGFGAGCAPSGLAEARPDPSPRPRPALVSVERTLAVRGTLRRYRVMMPSDLRPGEKLPLVIFVHCSDSDPARSLEDSGFVTLAERERAVLVAPATRGPHTGWTSHPAIFPGTPPSDDISFFRRLVPHLKKTLPVDPKRAYLVGHRSGGMMAHRVAADMGAHLAAVAVVGGTIGVTAERTGRSSTLTRVRAPVPVLIMHGERDEAIPFHGGRGAHAPRRYRSVRDAVSFWIRSNGAAWEPERVELAAGRTLRAIYRDARGRPVVVFFRLVEQGSEWPSAVAAGESGETVNASELIWAFFVRNRR